MAKPENSTLRRSRKWSLIIEAENSRSG
jgi:hypothetical protein